MQLPLALRMRGRFVWKLPLNRVDRYNFRFARVHLDRITAVRRHLRRVLKERGPDAEGVKVRLENLAKIERKLLRLRHSILQRARSAYRLRRGWRPHPASRLLPPT